MDRWSAVALYWYVRSLVYYWTKWEILKVRKNFRASGKIVLILRPGGGILVFAVMVTVCGSWIGSSWIGSELFIGQKNFYELKEGA